MPGLDIDSVFNYTNDNIISLLVMGIDKDGNTATNSTYASLFALFGEWTPPNDTKEIKKKLIDEMYFKKVMAIQTAFLVSTEQDKKTHFIKLKQTELKQFILKIISTLKINIFSGFNFYTIMKITNLYKEESGTKDNIRKKILNLNDKLVGLRSTFKDTIDEVLNDINEILKDNKKSCTLNILAAIITKHPVFFNTLFGSVGIEMSVFNSLKAKRFFYAIFMITFITFPVKSTQQDDLFSNLIKSNDIIVDLSKLKTISEQKRATLDARQMITVNRFTKFRYRDIDKACFLFHGVGTGKTITAVTIALSHLSDENVVTMDDLESSTVKPLRILVVCPSGLFRASFISDCNDNLGIYTKNIEIKQFENGSLVESCDGFIKKDENSYYKLELIGYDYDSFYKDDSIQPFFDLYNYVDKFDVLICDEAHRLITNNLMPLDKYSGIKINFDQIKTILQRQQSKIQSINDILDTTVRILEKSDKITFLDGHRKNTLTDGRFLNFCDKFNQIILLTGTPIQKNPMDVVDITYFLNNPKINKSNIGKLCFEAFNKSNSIENFLTTFKAYDNDTNTWGGLITNLYRAILSGDNSGSYSGGSSSESPNELDAELIKKDEDLKNLLKSNESRKLSKEKFIELYDGMISNIQKEFNHFKNINQDTLSSWNLLKNFIYKEDDREGKRERDGESQYTVDETTDKQIQKPVSSQKYDSTITFPVDTTSPTKFRVVCNMIPETDGQVVGGTTIVNYLRDTSLYFDDNFRAIINSLGNYTKESFNLIYEGVKNVILTPIFVKQLFDLVGGAMSIVLYLITKLLITVFNLTIWIKDNIFEWLSHLGENDILSGIQKMIKSFIDMILNLKNFLPDQDIAKAAAAAAKAAMYDCIRNIMFSAGLLFDTTNIANHCAPFVSIYNYDHSQYAIDQTKFYNDIRRETKFSTVNATGTKYQFPQKYIEQIGVAFTEDQINKLIDPNTKVQKTDISGTFNVACGTPDNILSLKDELIEKYDTTTYQELLEKRRQYGEYNFADIQIKKGIRLSALNRNESLQSEQSENRSPINITETFEELFLLKKKFATGEELSEWTGANAELLELKQSIESKLVNYNHLLNEVNVYPSSETQRFDNMLLLLKVIRCGAIYNNNEFNLHPHYIKSNSDIEYYLPVIYPTTEEIMYGFCDYLNKNNVKYIWQCNQFTSEKLDDNYKCGRFLTYPITDKDNDNPICIIISPDHTEGFSFSYNPAIFCPALCKTAGDEEQVYGRVLRKYGLANAAEGIDPTGGFKGQYNKKIYQYFGASLGDLDNIKILANKYGVDKKCIWRDVERNNNYFDTVSNILQFGNQNIAALGAFKSAKDKLKNIFNYLSKSWRNSVVKEAYDYAYKRKKSANEINSTTIIEAVEPEENVLTKMIYFNTNSKDQILSEEYHLTTLSQVKVLSKTFFKLLVEKENSTLKDNRFLPLDINFINNTIFDPSQKIYCPENDLNSIKCMNTVTKTDISKIIKSEYFSTNPGEARKLYFINEVKKFTLNIEYILRDYNRYEKRLTEYNQENPVPGWLTSTIETLKIDINSLLKKSSLRAVYYYYINNHAKFNNIIDKDTLKELYIKFKAFLNYYNNNKDKMEPLISKFSRTVIQRELKDNDNPFKPESSESKNLEICINGIKTTQQLLEGETLIKETIEEYNNPENPDFLWWDVVWLYGVGNGGGNKTTRKGKYKKTKKYNKKMNMTRRKNKRYSMRR